MSLVEAVIGCVSLRGDWFLTFMERSRGPSSITSVSSGCEPGAVLSVTS